MIRGTDCGIWSRIRLVPFAVSFDGREDRTLKDRLLKELPGILAWAVRGCMRWQESGLGTCESVSAATSEYRAESDQFARFIEEVCVVGEYFSVRAKSLYGAYRIWAERSGESLVSETGFGRRLVKRGFDRKHTEGGRVYLGIGLRAES